MLALSSRMLPRGPMSLSAPRARLPARVTFRAGTQVDMRLRPRCVLSPSHPSTVLRAPCQLPALPHGLILIRPTCAQAPVHAPTLRTSSRLRSFTSRQVVVSPFQAPGAPARATTACTMLHRSRSTQRHNPKLAAALPAIATPPCARALRLAPTPSQCASLQRRVSLEQPRTWPPPPFLLALRRPPTAAACGL